MYKRTQSAQAPYLTSVIFRTRNHHIALIVEITTEYLIIVTLQDLQALPSIGTPQATRLVVASRK